MSPHGTLFTVKAYAIIIKVGQEALDQDGPRQSWILDHPILTVRWSARNTQ